MFKKIPAIHLSDFQKEVTEIYNSHIMGHVIQNDFKVLFLSHPKKTRGIH